MKNPKSIKQTLLFAAFTFILITSACTSPTIASGAGDPISHQSWDDLLKKHVASNGEVDYKGFQKDEIKLDAYLKLLSDNAPNESTWSQSDQIAYWINAYNAFTVKLVLKYYPLESIRDLGDKIQIPFVNTAWDIKFIKIGGAELDLNNIEHGILRAKFDEPRVHFALNCASYSCPILRNEAYTATSLDKQLQEQAALFINDATKNKMSANTPQLSSIFDWYGGDFKKKTTLIAYLNQYSKVKIAANAKIMFLDYNWALNDKN
jgi:hypothetical protein